MSSENHINIVHFCTHPLLKVPISTIKSLLSAPLRVIAVIAVVATIAISIACWVYSWSHVVEFMEDLGKVMIPLSIIIGAVWAHFTFGCGWQAAIDIRLNASQKVLADDDNLYISGEVEISNHGSRNVRLPYDDSNPFSLYRVTFKEKGRPSFDSIAGIPPVYLKSCPGSVAKSTIVRAHSTERLPFFTAVSEPGLYLLTFCAKVPKNEEAKAREAGARDWVKWSGATYVIVRQPRKTNRN